MHAITSTNAPFSNTTIGYKVASVTRSFGGLPMQQFLITRTLEQKRKRLLRPVVEHTYT